MKWWMRCLVPEILLMTNIMSFFPQQQLVAKEQEAIVIRPDKTLDLPTLLIVEDNKELQIALEEHLSVNYNVLIADNGRIGLESVKPFIRI